MKQYFAFLFLFFGITPNLANAQDANARLKLIDSFKTLEELYSKYPPSVPRITEDKFYYYFWDSNHMTIVKRLRKPPQKEKKGSFISWYSSSIVSKRWLVINVSGYDTIEQPYYEGCATASVYNQDGNFMGTDVSFISPDGNYYSNFHELGSCCMFSNCSADTISFYNYYGKLIHKYADPTMQPMTSKLTGDSNHLLISHDASPKQTIYTFSGNYVRDFSIGNDFLDIYISDSHKYSLLSSYNPFRIELQENDKTLWKKNWPRITNCKFYESKKLMIVCSESEGNHNLTPKEIDLVSMTDGHIFDKIQNIQLLSITSNFIYLKKNDCYYKSSIY